MATYDPVRCELPLPVDDVSIAHLQTKDFSLELDIYTIDRHGYLLRNGINMDFHGTMRFHGVDCEWNLYEFKARFHEGDLVDICLVSQSR